MDNQLRETYTQNWRKTMATACKKYSKEFKLEVIQMCDSVFYHLRVLFYIVSSLVSILIGTFSFLHSSMGFWD